MISRDSFSYLSGSVESVAINQETTERHRSGGVVILPDIWFVIPSSRTVNSTTAQCIRLKTPQGEREVKLIGMGLSVVAGQRITILSLAGSPVTYINHSTGSVLKPAGSLEKVAGQRPLAAWKSALCCFTVAFGLIGFASGQAASSHKSELQTFWTLLALPLLLALVALPLVGFLIGFIRTRKYRERTNTINDLVEAEVESLLKN